ncbi:MAG: DNA/RNA nuclease SfsA [Methanomicrobiales archaeon]
MIIDNLIEGYFVERPNRFLILFEAGGEVHKAHLKDPGRLKELLIPRVKLLIRPVTNKTNRKTKYDVIAVLHENKWVLINSGFHSAIAANLIESKTINELNNYSIEKREYTYGKSRIDFLLSDNKNKMLLEVKGCTLVEDGLALFPDAPTLRGKKHVEELISSIKDSFSAAILFLIMREDAKKFSPNYEMDPEFSNTLKMAFKKDVKILAYSFKVILKKDKLEIEPFKPIKVVLDNK